MDLHAVMATLLPEHKESLLWRLEVKTYSQKLAIGNINLDSQGICASQTHRFCWKQKEADGAYIYMYIYKKSIMFILFTEIFFVFLSCERLMFI